MLLDSLLFSVLGDNMAEYCSHDNVSAVAGTAERLRGTDVLETDPGETDVAVRVDEPIGGRGRFLLKTDGALAETPPAAALVRRCNDRLTLRDDEGRFVRPFLDICHDT